MLNDAGLDRSEVFCTNIAPARPPGNDMSEFFLKKKEAALDMWGLNPYGPALDGIATLAVQLTHVDPEIVIGLGNYALWALGQDVARITTKSGKSVPSGIGSWRGSQLYTRPEFGERKFVPIYHPAAILRQWSWRQITVQDIRTRVAAQLHGAVKWYDSDNYIFHTRPTYMQVMDFITNLLADADTLPESLELADDIETRYGYMSCVGLAANDREAICIPFMCTERDSGYWEPWQEAVIRKRLRKLYSHPNVWILGQNFLYDLQYHHAELIPVSPYKVYDTMIAQHVCWPGTPKDLSYISSLYCRYHRYWKDEGKLWEPWMDEEQHWNYNCRDAVVTKEAAVELQAVVKACGLERQCQMKMEEIPVAFDMMLHGIPTDAEHQGEILMELLDAIAAREQWLTGILPRHLVPEMKTKKAAPWYRSPKQLMQLFYDTLGVEPVRSRKTGKISTDDESLKIIIKREPSIRPIIERIQELRSMKKAHEIAARPLDPDGMMRCSFNVGGAETMRWSSSENAWGRGGNMQNISKGHEID